MRILRGGVSGNWYPYRDLENVIGLDRFRKARARPLNWEHPEAATSAATDSAVPKSANNSEPTSEVTAN